MINADKVCFGYSKDHVILKNVTFNVPKGHFFVIAGPNGVGKSTLLYLMGGLLKPRSGIIKIGPKNIHSVTARHLARHIATVRQEHTPVFDFNVEQIVSMGRSPYYSLLNFSTDKDEYIVNEAMTTTQISQFRYRPLSHLSGGERQRVFIARAIAQDTSILLLDEPTSFLDLKYQVGIYDLLKQMQIEKNKTIVLVTHSINLAMQYADTVLLLGQNHHYHLGPTREILTQKIIEAVFDVKTISIALEGKRFHIPYGKYL